MRVITTVTEAFPYEELSDEAKEKAREKFAENPYLYSWGDDNRLSLDAFCEMVGIKPDWAISLSSPSYCHPVSHDYEMPWEWGGSLIGLRLRTWVLNAYGYMLTEGKPYGQYTKSDIGKWGYKHRSNIIRVERSCPFTGMHMDESLLLPIRKFIAEPDKTTTFPELIQECLDSWVTDYVADWEGTYTDEAIVETIEANEYEFTADGEMI